MNGEFRRADVDFFFSTKKEFREGNGRNVNVWLQSRSLPARGRVGLEVLRCLCIIDAGTVFISTLLSGSNRSCRCELFDHMAHPLLGE
jgi:hypothetical protein